jgi:hypothetical protein
MAEVRYPKSWKEMSLDFKLMFGYHGSMMAMMLAGGLLSILHELAIAGAIASLSVLISWSNRRKKHWRWPGIKRIDPLYAVGALSAPVLLYSATPLFPPNNGHIVPWYLAGLGIGLFLVLQSLKVVYPSEAEFASNCMIIDQYGRRLQTEQELSPAQAPEVNWRRATKAAYTIVFMLLWVCWVASFYFFGAAIRNGSPEPTTTQTEPLEDHGKPVYVTPVENQRVHALQLVSSVGIPLVLISGVILHFVVGVKLFPNAPTVSEYLNRCKNRGLP